MTAPASARPAALPTVLFVTYGGGHAELVHLLLKENTDNPKYLPIVLALTTAGAYFEDRGIPHITCRSLVADLGLGIVTRVGEDLAREVWQPGGPVSLEESAAYLGVSMADLITDQGEEGARLLYAEQGRSAFCPTRFMGQVLDHLTPAVVVTTCHVRMEKAAILAAQDRDVTGVTIDDLFGINLYSKGPDGGAVPAEEWPDHYVVLNEFTAERIAALGMERARIHALGQPVFALWQALAEHLPDTPEDEQARGCWPEGARRLLYIATSREDILVAHVTALAQAVPPDAHCVIKLHPSTPMARFQTLCPDLPETLSVTAEANSYALVRTCDLALTHQSTLGVYCLVAGVLLITLDDPFGTSHTIYEDFGYSVRVRDPAALAEVLSGPLPTPERSRLPVPADASAAINRFLAGLA